MPDASWKRVERDIAEFMHGERIPVADRRLGDVKTPAFIIEVKHRASLPLNVYRELPQRYYIITRKKQDFMIRPALTLEDLYTTQRDGIAAQMNQQTIAFYTRGYAEGAISNFPKWLIHGIDQALDAAEYHKLIPCVVLHPKHTPIKDCLCLLIRKL